MKLFLHIELTKWQDVGYEKPLLTYASSLSGDLIGAEMDNQSDASIADLVIKLCDQMQSIFVSIQAQPTEPFGSTLKLLNNLLRTNQKIHAVVLSGDHEQAEKLFKHLQSRFRKESDAEKIKILIKEFALA
ncbi:MAG: hypothetical protein KBF45_14770 [Cyclobacteriaceae bacterium]|nr:hypothetical protein [Cyclobacteriaceae bacterium]